MSDHDVFLEQALLEEGRLTEQQRDEARRIGTQQGLDLYDALVEANLLSGRAISQCKAAICEVPFVELRNYEPCHANSQLLPRSFAERRQVFPLFMIDGVLTVATDDPFNLDTMDQVRDLARCEVDAVICERELIRNLLSRAYSLSYAKTPVVTDAVDDEEQADGDSPVSPVVAAVNQLLADAASLGASDVHINPDEHDLYLRYRIDGVLRPQQGPPLSMHPGIVQRLKVMASLDLTQSRRPQDGKFRFQNEGDQIEVRLSIMPTVSGENIVMRLQASNRRPADFSELGMPPPVSQRLKELITSPYGMLLVTGPTGSGKTTTLYGALNALNDPSCNIMTIEDPVEIRLPYVRQIQVHHEIGLTFASALRSILRQDPDVVLVGEIRDKETASIALQAALTGHLVLSTLHTNDAAGAIARLRDFGLPSFVINSAVLAVLAQRLVRKVCDHCQQEEVPNELVRHRFGLQENVSGFRSGAGCGRCGQTGYRGRIGLYELLALSPELKTLIEQECSTEELRHAAVDRGVRLMWQDGLTKAQQGLTTLEEVAKVTSIIQLTDRDSHADAADPQGLGAAA